MGSLTNANQLDLDKALEDRNKKFNVDHKVKAELRKEIVTPGVAASKCFKTMVFDSKMLISRV